MKNLLVAVALVGLVGVIGWASNPKPARDTKEPARPEKPAPALNVGEQAHQPQGTLVSSKGRIFVAVQTAPGSALEGEEKDPYRGTAILSVDPDTGASESIVDRGAHPRLSADGRTMLYVTSKGIAVRSGTTRRAYPRAVREQRSVATLP